MLSSWRTALEATVRVALTEKVFERPEGFDLQTWMQRSFGIWQEDVYDVVWRFTPEAAADARFYLFHPTQIMTDETDGSLTVSFRAGGLREMCWHLFRWGNHVKIIAPRELQLLYQELMITTA